MRAAGLAAHLALAARLAGLGPERHQTLDERGAEGDRLAGAGAAAAEHVLAGEHVRDGRGLDRERAGCAELVERAHDVAAEAEVGEGHALDVGGQDRLGLEALEHDVVVGGEGRLLVARRVEGGCAVAAGCAVVEVAARVRGRSPKSRRGARSSPKSRRGRAVTVVERRDAAHGRRRSHDADARSSSNDAARTVADVATRRAVVVRTTRRTVGRRSRDAAHGRRDERRGRSVRSSKSRRGARSSDRRRGARSVVEVTTRRTVIAIAARARSSSSGADASSSKSRRGARRRRTSRRGRSLSYSRRGARSSRRGPSAKVRRASLPRGSQLGRSLRPAAADPPVRSSRAPSLRLPYSGPAACRAVLGAPAGLLGRALFFGAVAAVAGAAAARRLAALAGAGCAVVSVLLESGHDFFLGCSRVHDEARGTVRASGRTRAVSGRGRSHTVMIHPPIGGETGPLDYKPIRAGTRGVKSRLINTTGCMPESAL